MGSAMHCAEAHYASASCLAEPTLQRGNLGLGVRILLERERRAAPRAARPLDAQHPGECLAVHGDAHEVVAARDGGRSAAEPTESPAAPGPPAPAGATKCLGDEPEAAQPTAAPPAGATLAGEGDA